jgi:alpha-L-fucosidase 2
MKLGTIRPLSRAAVGRRLLGVALPLLLFFSAALQSSAAQQADAPVNLSLGSSARAVASYQDGSLTADKAIDGNG